MKILLCAGLAIAAVGAPGMAQSDCTSLDALEWLLGDWTAEGEKTSFHESWNRVAPRTFEGSGIERSKADGEVRGVEALRLVEMAEGVFYVSKVSHNELPVAFRLSECADGRFVFVNPAHDFPRRLEYARGEQERLTVRVDDGAGKGFTLAFARIAGHAGPVAAVLAAEDARFAAMAAGDRAEMHRWLATDLTYVHSTGEVENRDRLIESIVSGNRRYLAIEPGERQVTFLDEAAAVVQGSARLRVATGAGPISFDARYLAVYVLVEGGWQLHAWQSVRLPEG